MMRLLPVPPCAPTERQWLACNGPSQVLHAYVVSVHGRPWFVTDLHPNNFISDPQGQARVNDPVIGQITPHMLSKVAGLGSVVKQAMQEEQRLGDRSLRLFMAAKVNLRGSPVENSDSALYDFYLNGADARTKAATVLGRDDFTRAEAESVHGLSPEARADDLGTSPRPAGKINQKRTALKIQQQKLRNKKQK